MKKIKMALALLMSAALMFSFCACGSNDTPIETGETTTTEYYEPETEEITEPPTEETTTEPINVKFQTATNSYRTNEGYNIDLTVKYSPWIHAVKDRDVLDAYWSEVNDGYALTEPTKDGWVNYTDITDFYYCVGTVTLENKTDGWDATEEKPLDPTACIYTDEGGSFFGHTFYSDGISNHDRFPGVYFGPRMTTNSAKLTFILCAADYASPAHPKGLYNKCRKNVFYFGRDNSKFYQDECTEVYIPDYRPEYTE